MANRRGICDFTGTEFTVGVRWEGVSYGGSFPEFDAVEPSLLRIANPQ